MPISIDELKSAVVHADPEAVAAKLQERAATRHTWSGPLQEEDDRTGLLKASAGLAAAAGFDPDADELRKMAVKRGITWSDDLAERGVAYWASDERVDRHGDIVRQNWDLRTYAQNPLILYGHDWDAPPIGNSVKEAVIDRADKGRNAYKGPALMMLALFNDFAGELFELIKSGFLRTGSVGFFPGAVIEIADDEERAELGLGPRGMILGDKDHPNELIEFTVASVPANVGAHTASLKALKDEGLLHGETVQLVRELWRRECRRHKTDDDKTRWLERDASLCTTWQYVFPEVEVPRHYEMDVPLLLEELERQYEDAEDDQDTADEVDDRSIEVKLDDAYERLDAIEARLDQVGIGTWTFGDTNDEDIDSEQGGDVLAELLDMSEQALEHLKTRA